VTSDEPSDDRATEPSGGLAASKSRPDDATIPAGLHIVATPIGNAADITLRALEVLRRADLIACEDTRVTGNLLARYEIGTRRLAYNDHNAERVRPLLLERLRRGARVALVSDAGMPLVSDPGYKLVRAAIAEGLPVTTVPGASAPLAALALSGLPSDRFLFAGFLPSRSAARRRDLAELAAVPATLILFESARRLGGALADMEAVLGDRPAAVAREMTKRFEEVRRDSLAALAAHYAAAGPPKGEIVIVIGPPASAPPENETQAAVALDDMLRDALAGASLRDAAAAVAIASGLPRRAVYARALALAGQTGKR
jgi:16S rRNA (cytidine1402-2'-O)-methyltransferase